jgi:uncharacterized protein YaiE (UPF0345 family)
MVVISTVAASTLTTTSDSLKMRAYDSADWSLHITDSPFLSQQHGTYDLTQGASSMEHG